MGVFTRQAGSPSRLPAPLVVCNPLGGPGEKRERQNFNRSDAVVLDKPASPLLGSPLCEAGPVRPSVGVGRSPGWRGR